MKIGIFLEKFTDTEINKDPGIITDYLKKNNIATKIFSQFASNAVMSRYQVGIINNQTRNTVKYWKQANINVLIIYSWLSLRYSKMILAAKKAGLKIILKLDSDGYLIKPFKPSYLRTVGKNNSLKELIKFFLRIIQWKVFTKIVSKNRLHQLAVSDAAIIESPMALKNIYQSLSYCDRDEMSPKIYFIPDPIHPNILSDLSNISNKKNTIICIGRWDDKQKNKQALIKTLKQFNYKDWKITIIGRGSNKIKEKLSKHQDDIKISAYEFVNHKKINHYLKESKIFFAPSNYESFNIAAAEALCCGCSLVGSPLPSFNYFIKNGFSGTLTKDFKIESFIKALQEDIKKWDNNVYQPSEISRYWQKELDADKIAKQIIDLAKSL